MQVGGWVTVDGSQASESARQAVVREVGLGGCGRWARRACVGGCFWFWGVWGVAAAVAFVARRGVWGL